MEDLLADEEEEFDKDDKVIITTTQGRAFLDMTLFQRQGEKNRQIKSLSHIPSKHSLHPFYTLPDLKQHCGLQPSFS